MNMTAQKIDAKPDGGTYRLSDILSYWLTVDC
jgi:hypothetical protein